MDILVLKEAEDNNNVITFKRKDEDGLELWYSGYVTKVKPTESLFDFTSIYGNSFSFDVRELIELKGPKPRNFYELDPVTGEFIKKPVKERKYIIFDTETTGLPKNWKAPVSDTENWPRVIQVAWSVCDEEGKEIDHKDIIIKPDGFTIPEDSIKVHGITQERAEAVGISLKEAMDIFKKSVEGVDALVAHNISYDEMVIGCEYYRLDMKDPMLTKEKICTKESSVDYCKIPGRGGRYSWASLAELYSRLFGGTFDNAHNASNDVRACAKCFFELKRLGVIN